MYPSLPMPDSVRQYLHLRGITDGLIKQFRLGYTEVKGNGWITIPVKDGQGNHAFHKLRAVPGSAAPNKYMYDPAGSSAELYGRGLLPLPNIDRVVVCEGEFDAMLLIAHNIPAVTSTSGVQTFKDEWVDLFPPDCHVILCFDNDAAGDKGRAKVRALFKEKRSDCRLSHVVFNDDNTSKGYDVSDLYQDTGEDGFIPTFLARAVSDDVLEAAPTEEERTGGIHRSQEAADASVVEEGEGEEVSPADKEKESLKRFVNDENGLAADDRIAKLSPPVRPVALEEWRAVISEQFPKLASTAEVCASVVAQLLILDVANPFSLILTDRPGSGKTITINFFRKLPELMYFTSDFTPASFVTSIAARSEKQLQNIDLLPKIRWKTLLVKDLAPLLSDNDDVLRKRLGMMTDILDGEGYRTESGVHGSRGYGGDYLFMFLAASTPFAPRVWKLMTGMGHRFFFIGLDSKRKRIDELKSQIQSTHYQTKVTVCRESTHEFLRTLWSNNPAGITWNAEKDDDATIERICELSDFLSMFRGDIYVHEEKWTDGRSLAHTEPRVEDASRINQCLYNLVRGHAVICGRDYITEDDLEVAIRVVLDTAPAPRPRIFRELLRRNGVMTIGEVAGCMGMGINTAKKEVHKFCALGLCDSEMMKYEAKNELEEFVNWEGQAHLTMVLKEEFMWWIPLINKREQVLKEEK